MQHVIGIWIKRNITHSFHPIPKIWNIWRKHWNTLIMVELNAEKRPTLPTRKKYQTYIKPLDQKETWEVIDDELHDHWLQQKTRRNLRTSSEYHQKIGLPHQQRTELKKHPNCILILKQTEKQGKKCNLGYNEKPHEEHYRQGYRHGKSDWWR